jgi:diguanylate cyclase (GGDEF)-like protein/PAS domain S-box-containing protein
VPGRILLALLVCATLLIGWIGERAFCVMRDDIRQEAQRTLAVIAEQKRQQIEHWIAQTRLAAELYFSGSAPFVSSFEQWLAGDRQDHDLLERMRTRLEDVARLYGWDGLAVFDPEGGLVFVFGATDDVGEHADTIQDILRHPDIQAVELHRHADGAVKYGRLAPIGRSGAAPLGVAYLIWRADRTLYQQVETWPVPTESAETYLVRPEKDRVRFLTPLRFQSDAAFSLTQPLTAFALSAAVRAARGERGLLEQSQDYRGTPVLAYATTIAGTPWLMIAKIDQAEVDAGLRTVAWTTVLVALLGLLLIYGIGYGVWRWDRQRRELAAAHERERVQAQLREHEASLAFVVEGSRLGTWDWNIATGEVKRNDYWAEMLGFTPLEVNNATAGDWLELIHPDDRERAWQSVADHLAGRITRHELEYRMRTREGDYRWILDRARIVSRDAEGRPTRMSGTHEDITSRKEEERKITLLNAELRHANAELERLATTDTLTGVWNRRYLAQILASEVGGAKRYDEPLALIMFDIDHFKRINDRHGHLTGDRILRELTQRVRSNLRAADVLARWGGEEFLILVPHCTVQDAAKLAEKLRILVESEPFSGVGQVTCSFGVAGLQPDEPQDAWLKRVDDALYAAKSAGRNRVCVGE